MPEDDRRFAATRPAAGTIFARVVANALLPAGLYAMLRHGGVDDFRALAAGAAIPLASTVGQWLWRRRIDWIGVAAVVGFATEVAIAALLGGNTFLLKTRAAVLTGPAGLVLLASAAAGRPLLVPLLRLLRPAAPVRSGALQRISHDPAARRRITIATALVGAVLAVHAALAITLALLLPSEAFLLVSKGANWTLAGVALAAMWWVRRRHRAPREGQREVAPDTARDDPGAGR